MNHRHPGAKLSTDTVNQVNQLHRAACVNFGFIRKASTPSCYRCGILTRTSRITNSDVISDHRDVREDRAALHGLAECGPTAAPASQEPVEEDQVLKKVREATISVDAQIDLEHLNRTPPFTFPARFARRMGSTWAEALEGCMAGVSECGTLAAYRARFILAPIPTGANRIEELGERLDLWDQGRFDDLIGKIVGQQVQDAVRAETEGEANEERLATQTRKETAAGATGKAFKGLTGAVAQGTIDERKSWTLQQIPRSDLGDQACTTREERKDAGRLAWGGGDTKKATRAFRDTAARNKSAGKLPVLPLTKLGARSSKHSPPRARQEKGKSTLTTY